MSSYELTEDAEDDLRGIVTYTLDNYGAAQMMDYTAKLEECAEHTACGIGHFKEIKVRGKSVRVKHCQHHYIFGLMRCEGLSMLVIAVFHESMDLMRRLRKRIT